MIAPTAPRRESGFSLVELLVAMLIGLIGIIIMLQVFENAEGVRRTTVSGGDAQQNGALALYVLERDLRNAGMGVNDIGLMTPPCNMIGYDAARSTPNFPPVGSPIPLAPVQIVAGGNATTPDQINVFYGSQTMAATTNLVVPVAMTANPNALTVGTTFGYRPGDLLLLFQPNPGAAVQNCIFMEVTSINANQVFHAPGAYTLANSGKSTTARFNPPDFSGTNAAMALTYNGNKVVTNTVTRVYNLGNLHDGLDFPFTQNQRMPAYNTYAVQNNTTACPSSWCLSISNAFAVAGGSPTFSALADNIVHMRADYGLDDGLPAGTAGDGILDRFLDPTAFDALPAATKPWQYVIAIRIAVVARSALIEKPGPGVACDGSTPFPTWSGNTAATRGFDLSTIPVPPGTFWDCYRYRVFETIVPVRNSIWKAS
jgi:type IV pilus assembly protein PilW